MTAYGFSGSYAGDNARIGPNTRLECNICWYVYDPAIGDDYWHIEPGTPFADLPAHWSCPNCDGNKHDFMVLLDSQE